MAFSQTDLDRIDACIASGTLTVRMGEKLITYRTIAELLEQRNVIAAALASRSGPRYRTANFQD